MLIRIFKNLLIEEDGPTAVEYAVMLALILIVCIATIQRVGQDASGIFNDAAGAAKGITP